MPIQRLALGLSAINLVLLVSLLARGLAAAPRDTAPVLRGRALEIVDDGGKLRAQLVVLPPSKGPDGKPYPETVLFRLIDPNGRPAVKIGASAGGAAVAYPSAIRWRVRSSRARFGCRSWAPPNDYLASTIA